MRSVFLAFLLLVSANVLLAKDPSRQQQTENIATFARLYGYVRYFHPSDEASAVNWENFLYYGIREVEGAKNKKDLAEKLHRLFRPIAPTVKIKIGGQNSTWDIKSSIPQGHEPPYKEVFWQHLGIGIQPGLYRSIRSNRPTRLISEKTRGFGSSTNSINAVPFRGRKIRLRSVIKAGERGGQGQMWLRVDRSNNKMGFFDNMQSRPIKTPEWSRCEINGKVDEDAEWIFFGAFLSGLGEVWVDDFTLEVETDGRWESIPFKNPSFDESDNEATGWITNYPGYTYTVAQVDGISGKNALIIRDNSVLKFEECIFDTKPQPGEYISKDLGNGIWCMMPLSLFGTDTQTFPATDVVALKKLESQIKNVAPKEQNVDDPYLRITGLVMAWNIFRHFYPYHDEVNAKWDNQLLLALDAARDVKNVKEFYSLLSIFTETLKDGHVYISGPGQPEQFSIPLRTTLAEGKIVVNHVDSSYVNEKPLKPGDIIIAVDGKSSLELLDEICRKISGSQQWKQSRGLSQLFNGPKGSELALTVRRGAEEVVVRFTRGISNTRNEKLTHKVSDNIYYVNISNTEMKVIREMLPDLARAKGIICDLRGYPNANHELINHLLSVKDTNTWMFVPQIVYPDFEKVSYKSLGWQMEPAKPHIQAKVVFLTGGGAISYAESYMGFIKNYKLATIVGQPTAGANGNVNSFNLPGNYSIRFTGMKVKQQDGSQLQSVGIQPDVFVTETIKGITEGRDEYFDKALEILTN